MDLRLGNVVGYGHVDGLLDVDRLLDVDGLVGVDGLLDVDGMLDVDGLRNGNVDGLDDMVNMDGDKRNSCCCWWWSWCGCSQRWRRWCFCGRGKIMPLRGRDLRRFRGRCRLVWNEHRHRLRGRFSLLLCLWREDQREQAREKTLLLVLRCWCWRLCCQLFIVVRRL